MKRDLISFALWTTDELSEILKIARKIKTGSMGAYTPMLKKSASLIFERPSLRTRVSFEVGISQLGGHATFLQQETVGLATRESVHDIASVLSRYNQLIIARTTRHQTLVQLAESATVPVINAMTDLVHPCQVLADALTLQELELFSPTTKIVFIGSGNNMANSWLELAEKLPLQLVLSCPNGYEPHPQILEQARAAKKSTITIVHDPVEAVQRARVLYTDVWPESIEEQERQARQQLFKQYQINQSLLKEADPGCIVMHRLPANRGEEITRDILDGKQSVVLHQAENRLHVQKAIVGFLLERS
jgi:ornithine carbamoyltransferase